jgi:hypothetical protein
MDFSSYKVKQVYKNLLFFGSGAGWDSVGGSSITDGLGRATGLALFSDRLESSNPTRLAGSVLFPDNTAFTLTETSTSSAHGNLIASLSQSQILVQSATDSVRVNAHSLTINSVTYVPAPDPYQYIITTAIAGETLAELDMVAFDSASLVKTDYDQAFAVVESGSLSGGTPALVAFGGILNYSTALKGTKWWAVNNYITSLYSQGAKIVGVSPTDGRIVLWSRDKYDRL